MEVAFQGSPYNACICSVVSRSCCRSHVPKPGIVNETGGTRLSENKYVT